MGRGLGRLAWRAGGRRRRIAEANIDLCFPELSERERAGLVRRTFQACGIGLMETVQAWLGRIDAVADRLECHGLDVLVEAQAEGRGVLLAGAHFLTLDFTGALLAARVPFDVVYRGHRNPVIEWLMVRGRRRHYGTVIERHDLRRAARRLRDGHIVWYAADQDYGRRHSVFAPLFGVPAATVVATARLARMGGSPVVFYSHFRNEETRTWSVRFQRVDDFPSGDDEADAARLNGMLEARDPAPPRAVPLAAPPLQDPARWRRVALRVVGPPAQAAQAPSLIVTIDPVAAGFHHGGSTWPFPAPVLLGRLNADTGTARSAGALHAIPSNRFGRTPAC